MINIESAHLDCIKTILKRNLPDQTVWLYGSRIKSSVKPFSDVDLCIKNEQSLSTQKLFQLREDFSDSNLPFRVDVCEWATTKPEFQRVIEEDYVVIQT